MRGDAYVRLPREGFGGLYVCCYICGGTGWDGLACGGLHGVRAALRTPSSRTRSVTRSAGGRSVACGSCSCGPCCGCCLLLQQRLWLLLLRRRRHWALVKVAAWPDLQPPWRTHQLHLRHQLLLLRRQRRFLLLSPPPPPHRSATRTRLHCCRRRVAALTLEAHRLASHLRLHGGCRTVARLPPLQQRLLRLQQGLQRAV